MDKELKRREGVPADPHGADGFINKPPWYVCVIIAVLVIFYIVALIIAF